MGYLLMLPKINYKKNIPTMQDIWNTLHLRCPRKNIVEKNVGLISYCDQVSMETAIYLSLSQTSTYSLNST